MNRQMRYRHCQDRDTERLRRYCSDTAEVKVKRRWRDGRDTETDEIQKQSRTKDILESDTEETQRSWRY